jgi:hypothetical protein
MAESTERESLGIAAVMAANGSAYRIRLHNIQISKLKKPARHALQRPTLTQPWPLVRLGGRTAASAPLPVIYGTAEVGPRLLHLTTQIQDNLMTRLTWQEYFEQVIRAQLRDLAARQATDRELTERLRAIAAAYKLFLFDDNSSPNHADDGSRG